MAIESLGGGGKPKPIPSYNVQAVQSTPRTTPPGLANTGRGTNRNPYEENVSRLADQFFGKGSIRGMQAETGIPMIKYGENVSDEYQSLGQFPGMPQTHLRKDAFNKLMYVSNAGLNTRAIRGMSGYPGPLAGPTNPLEQTLADMRVPSGEWGSLMKRITSGSGIRSMASRLLPGAIGGTGAFTAMGGPMAWLAAAYLAGQPNVPNAYSQRPSRFP